MKKLLILLFAILISSSGLTEIENWYFQRTEYMDTTYIFISANRTTNVKCVVYDENDKPIRVTEDLVTPPLSEVLVISQDAVITSVQCWEQESSPYGQVAEALLLELAESLKEVVPTKLPFPLLGKMFPSIKGKDLYTNETIQVAGLLANKITLVNFWASWCVTCRAEHNKIMEISKQQDFQLIGINYKDVNSDAKKFLELRGNPFDVIISDPEGEIGLELGIYATPETFLVDKNGLIIYKHIGEINDEAWEVFKEQQAQDQLNTLRAAYINHIAARVRTYWRYQGAEDDWGCDVYVKQSIEGVVEAVNVQNCTLDDSDKARSFKNSIERAVYKASPLPITPDEAVFDKEVLFFFRVN